MAITGPRRGLTTLQWIGAVAVVVVLFCGGFIWAILSYWAGNVPIEFYGIAVDQYDRPLPNEPVIVEISTYGLFPPHGPGYRNEYKREIVLTTDQGGRFFLKESGAAITDVHIGDASRLGGWVADEFDRLWVYDATWSLGNPIAHPNPEKPVKFRVWKDPLDEPAVSWIFCRRENLDSGSNEIAFWDRERPFLYVDKDRVDIEIRFSTAKERISKLEQMKILGRNGTRVSESTRDMPTQAPLNDYKQSVVVDIPEPGNSLKWSTLREAYLVCELKNHGGYCVVRLTLQHSRGGYRLIVAYRADKSGSRELNSPPAIETVLLP